MFWKLPPRDDEDRADTKGNFSDVDPEHWDKDYSWNRNTKWMALINRINAHREPADWEMANRGMFTTYLSVKLPNMVTWTEWYALVPRPNDQDEGK